MGKTAVNGSIDDETFEKIIDLYANGNPERVQLAQRLNQDKVRVKISSDAEGVEEFEAMLEMLIWEQAQP